MVTAVSAKEVRIRSNNGQESQRHHPEMLVCVRGTLERLGCGGKVNKAAT